MITRSLSIASYCVPCHAHCRYCLLSSSGQKGGAAYADSAAFAHRVMGELAEKRPGLPVSFYIGYCMDTPHLPSYIRFCQKHRSPSGRFLQMNGFAFRDDQALAKLMDGIQSTGVELIDLTFYGTEDYHDRFAGRRGDFSFLLRMLSAANQARLPVNVSIPLLRDNLDQMTALRQKLSPFRVEKFTYFLPHSKGRGKGLLDQRITLQEFDRLPQFVRDDFVKVKHQTESQWLSSGEITEPSQRSLTLVLTKENLESWREKSGEDILSQLEAMDDRYLSQLPSLPGLAARYGQKDNQQLFRLRDLALKWQQQYLADTGNAIYDMHDETHHFSVHF